MLLISYATDNYKEQQKALTLEATLCGFSIIEYSPAQIPEWYYLEHKLILDQKRGAGSALWKPYLLYQTMLNLKDGDKILYMDCGDKIIDFKFRYYVEDKLNYSSYFLVQNVHLNKYHTKRDCFTLMKCDEEYYWNYPILEAGVVGFVVNEYTLDFVYTWKEWCEQEDVVMDVGNRNIDGKENFPGYTNHKCDQSILTNLVAKWNYKTTPIQEVMQYVHYNYRG